MTNNPPCGMSRGARRAFAVAIMVMAASLAACSPKKDNAQEDPNAPHNVTLTADQMRHIRLYTVTPSRFHKTIETSGAVDFDNDQATSVISPGWLRALSTMNCAALRGSSCRPVERREARFPRPSAP